MWSRFILFSVLFLCCVHTEDANETMQMKNESKEELDLETYREKMQNLSQTVEKGLKNAVKSAVKRLLPSVMSYNKDSPLSAKCRGAFMKYISGMTSAKMWALRMFDATSKPPAGVLTGTFSDYGAFDQCLEVELPTRTGKVEFRGKYCAIEVVPRLPPMPKNMSFSKQVHAGPLASISDEFRIGGMAFFFLKFRLGICVPSLCTLEDMQALADKIGDFIEMHVKVPQCYVQEDLMFKPVHIAVIIILSLLLIACVVGSVTEYKFMDIESSQRNMNRWQQIVVCFSVISNFERLMSASKGSEELKALHGLRALSIAWVILGHTYVWTNFQLLRGPEQAVVWFNRLDFGPILNGWLSVEPFFFLSGLLTCYTVMKIMPKTKGRINLLIYILRRYLRLTPPLLLVIGITFFLPLLSHGPFWYEKVDPEIKSCTHYWWRSVLYISNWAGMKNICVHPTWYLSADFQLYVFSVVFLFILYRSPKLGLSLIAATVLAATVLVAILTAFWELPPIILISSGNNDQIEQTVDVVHMNTLTHAGPYLVGMVTGYLISKHKDVKMSKIALAFGWILSSILSLTSLYGAHRWNVGEPHGTALTAIYASLHRTTFTIGVAWVAMVCVFGHGGFVNEILSSFMLTPISRLTFIIYLIHPLVIWTRMGSMRDRTILSHYNILYDYAGNLVITVFLSVPIYLLIEAPLSNLERMIFSRASTTPNDMQPIDKVQVDTIYSHSLKHDVIAEVRDISAPVASMSLKTFESGCQILGFRDGLLKRTEGNAMLY